MCMRKKDKENVDITIDKQTVKLPLDVALKFKKDKCDECEGEMPRYATKLQSKKILLRSCKVICVDVKSVLVRTT